jgi:hypothetical protein
MPAIQNGIIRQDPYHQIKFKSKIIHKGFLTDEEIQMLTDVKLPNHDRKEFVINIYSVVIPVLLTAILSNWTGNILSGKRMMNIIY